MHLYEAIVTDVNPDPDLPGHIKVIIPELFGSNRECPVLIPPMFPGWSAGGWHSVPALKNPDDDTEVVRVIVAHLGPATFRWCGTSQGWSWVTDKPGERAGARSGDGRHELKIDNTDGFTVSVSSSDDTDGSQAQNYLYIGTDDTILMGTADGSSFVMNSTQVALIDAGGDTFVMGPDGISIIHKDGVASLSLKNGDTAALAGTVVQVSGGTIELGDGVIPPLNPYILSLSWMADMSLLCTDIVAVGAAIPTLTPYVASNAIAMMAKIATSLGAGAPYLSGRIYGS